MSLLDRELAAASDDLESLAPDLTSCTHELKDAIRPSLKYRKVRNPKHLNNVSSVVLERRIVVVLSKVHVHHHPQLRPGICPYVVCKPPHRGFHLRIR